MQGAGLGVGGGKPEGGDTGPAYMGKDRGQDTGGREPEAGNRTQSTVEGYWI